MFFIPVVFGQICVYIIVANPNGPNQEKLSQLRSKTDRQILKIFGSRLEEGLRSAAEDEAERAERAFREAQKLWAVMRQEHKRALAGRLDELREAVELRRWREPLRRSAASMF